MTAENDRLTEWARDPQTGALQVLRHIWQVRRRLEMSTAAVEDLLCRLQEEISEGTAFAIDEHGKPITSWPQQTWRSPRCQRIGNELHTNWCGTEILITVAEAKP